MTPTAIGLPTSGVVLTSARLVRTNAAADESGNRTAASEYCKVTGDIKPVDPQAPDIQFQVNLPTAWNGKAMQFGGGGNNGVIPRSVATGTGSPLGGTIPPNLPNPLLRGYITLGSDSGHQGDDPAWYGNEEAMANFGYAQMKKTHDVAVMLSRWYYGKAPRLFYYFGFSQGGREALEVAQRFPQDYDGIFSQAPVLYFASVIRAALTENMQLLPGTWLPPSKSATIAAEVLRQCDSLDGLSDGVINNYMACNQRFDPEINPHPYERIRCLGGGDAGPDCLSDAQIKTANMFRAPTRYNFELAHGRKLFPGFGTGLEAPVWGLLSPEQPDSARRFDGGRPGGFIRITIMGDANADVHQFSPDAYRVQIQKFAAKVDTSNPDLSAFLARGGKLIFKSHASDYTTNPRSLQHYYQAVVARLGQQKVDQFIRYYVTPNSEHSGAGKSASGEPIPQYVDAYTLLDDWVEKGVPPPDAPIQVAQLNDPPFTVTASKPMCRYPLYPRYREGDPKNAKSYVCLAP